jgi:hypothetical protein
VAFWYAIVKEGAGPITGVRMVHKKSRGSVQIDRNLVAFPAILTRGQFELAESDQREAELQALLEFVRSNPGRHAPGKPSSSVAAGVPKPISNSWTSA